MWERKTRHYQKIKNALVENARLENVAPVCVGGGKYGTEYYGTPKMQ